MSWSFNPFTGNLDLVGGGAVVFEGEVETFADLPEVVGDPPVGSSYLVRTSTGVWLVNRRQAGIWIRRNNTGVRADDWTYGGDYPVNSVAGKVGNVTLTASDVGAAAANHAAAHAATGSDPLAPSDIGAQSIFSVESLVLTTTSQVTLTAARAKIYDIVQYAGAQVDVKLPSTNAIEGDIVVMRWGTGGDSIRIIQSSSGSPVTTVSSGEQKRFIRGSTDNWSLVPVDTHTHNASAITSGTLDIARIPTGTGSTQVALGNHAHELTALAATGATNGHVLTANGSGGVTFAAASGGGVTGAASSASDVLGVSGANITGVDANADRIIFFDDSAGKLTHLTVGSGLSISDTTISATATGTIGGSTGSTDNSLLRSDGTGGSTAQASALVVDDAVVTFSTITGDAGTDIITATGSAFSNGQRVRFTALTGGSGLNTTTNYFVINASGATFQVSTSEGGAASLFTTNITAGTLLTGHSVQAHVAVRNNSSDTNSALVIAPKGTGALIAQIPDATTTGGNARGANAVDLQTARVTATAVASGQYSAIAGGYRNTASATSSSVGGGEINTASGSMSRVGGGKNNTASAASSVVAGGENNTASGGYSFVGGGYQNTASGQSSTVAGGGFWSPNQGNSATATNSAVLGGVGSVADRQGMEAFCAGRFAANGDAQRARFVLRCKTTTNSAVEMALDGSTTYLTIPSGKVIFCNIKVVGVKSDGSVVATYERQYAAKNVAGTSSEVYAAVTIGTDNASSTSLEVATVDAGDYIRIRPTGIASETWRWVASIDAVEVAYGT